MNLETLCIREDVRLIDAMEALDKGGRRILFIVEDERLLAVLTDGDVRRFILKSGDLNAPVKDVANYSPKFLIEEQIPQAKQFLKQHSIEALPVLDDQGRILSVVFWDDQKISRHANLTVPVVIMAGGLGTRLYPYTKILPKPLIPIGDLPIAQHIIDRFCDFGIRRFFMIVNHKKNMIKAYFNEIEKEYTIQFVDEEIPLGTGGGLSLLKGEINETFILSNCDILIEADYAQIVKFHQDSGNKITMIASTKRVKIPYGVVEVDSLGQIASMQEKPELSFLTNTGIYIVEPDVIDSMNVGENIGFPDVMTRIQKAGAKVGIYPISESAWMDMGELDQMEAMRERLNAHE